MITGKNIHEYINFLHDKRYGAPASETLLTRWQHLSDFEIIKELHGLYTFWGIDASTAATYERLFLQSQNLVPVTENVVASDPLPVVATEEKEQDKPVPRKKKSGAFKYILFVLILLLVAAATLWFYHRASKLSETNTELEKKVQQVKDSVDQERALRQQRESELLRQEQEKADKIKEVRANIGNYVTQKVTYDVNRVFGGIDEVRVTVTNNSDFKMNEVAVLLSYIKKNGDLYETKTITISNIPAHGQKTVSAPSSKRGTKLTSRIAGMQSDEMDGL